MKNLKLGFLAVSAALVMAPASAEGLSYGVGIYTANTDDTRGDDFRPSLELGAAYDFGNGFYVGSDFTTGQFGGQTSARGELAFNAGFGQELSSGISYDVNLARYIYSKSNADNYNELTLTLGYGPVSVAYYKSLDSDGFVSDTAGLDLTFSYSLTDQVATYVTATKSEGVSSLGMELGVSYDFGNNLSASAVYEKGATPKFVFGLAKSF